jgi:hypothetical protein
VTTVCCACQRELKCDRNGVLVIYRVRGEHRFYKAYNADRWKCPECGIEIISGFGSRPRLEGLGQSDLEAQVAKLAAETDLMGRTRPVYVVFV